MEITDIRIRKFSDDSKMRAIVSVTFDDTLVVHDIKIIESQDKTFLAMPSRRLPNGAFSDIAHPTKKDFREKIEKAVLDEFDRYKQGELEN